MISSLTNTDLNKLPKEIRDSLIQEIEFDPTKVSNWEIVVDYIAQKYLELQKENEKLKEENERLKKVEIIEPLSSSEFSKKYGMRRVSND